MLEGPQVTCQLGRKASSEIRRRLGSDGDAAPVAIFGRRLLEQNARLRAENKRVPQPLPVGIEWGTVPAPSAPTTALGTSPQVGELETRHGAGSALRISRGQGTGGPTGRPTPNQPVGAASPMPLHPLGRKSAAQPLPSGSAAYYFAPWTR